MSIVDNLIAKHEAETKALIDGDDYKRPGNGPWLAEASVLRVCKPSKRDKGAMPSLRRLRARGHHGMHRVELPALGV